MHDSRIAISVFYIKRDTGFLPAECTECIGNQPHIALDARDA